MIYAIIVAFITLDIISGLIKALYNKNLSSERMRKGLIHKMSYVMALALATLIDYSAVYMKLPYEIDLFSLVAVFVCSTEIVSIVENITKMLPDSVGNSIRDIFKVKDNDN